VNSGSFAPPTATQGPPTPLPLSLPTTIVALRLTVLTTLSGVGKGDPLIVETVKVLTTGSGFGKGDPLIVEAVRAGVVTLLEVMSVTESLMFATTLNPPKSKPPEAAGSQLEPSLLWSRVER
jgi:hypothetical protein